MSNRTKKMLAVIGFIIAIILLLLFAKKNPGIIKRVENALAPVLGGIIPTVGEFNIPSLDGYVPRDFPLPPLNDNTFINFGCNFCSKTSVQLAPPSPAIPAPAQVTSTVIYPQPFGGSGASYGYAGGV